MNKHSDDSGTSSIIIFIVLHVVLLISIVIGALECCRYNDQSEQSREIDFFAIYIAIVKSTFLLV